MLNSSLPPQIAVRLDNVSVKYSIPIDRVGTFKEYIIRHLHGPLHFQDFWALNNINLEIQTGESIGIIGQNGAGKSTLLKVISHVLFPTKGRLRIRGDISPLLELGAGFHPELTGIENIYLNGSLLGYSRSDINEKFNEILEFAQIGEFINAPLRTYSNGMIARLGFSVATAWKPNILILDEILSVGDEEFREKCSIRLNSFKERGTTIILVTHDLLIMQDLCSKAALLHKGELKFFGNVTDTINFYKSIGHFEE